MRGSAASVSSAARPATGPSTIAERNRLAQAHHWTVVHSEQEPVKTQNLRPSRWLSQLDASIVQGGNRPPAPEMGRPRPVESARRSRPSPSAIHRRDPRRDIGPARPGETSSPWGPVRASRRASVSSMRARSPTTSGSFWKEVVSRRVAREWPRSTGRPDRREGRCSRCSLR